MIYTINNYDVILLCAPKLEITGHLFECFDYYLFLRQYCKVGILFFNTLNISFLQKLFNDKYCVNFNDIKNDLIILNINTQNHEKCTVFFEKNTSVIIADGNIHALNYYNIFLISNMLYGFLCEKNLEYMSCYKNITYLQDYRVYGKNEYFNSIDYVKKLPFKFYKKSNKVFDNTGMIYMTYVCRKVLPEVIEKYHKMSGCNKTYLIVPYKLPEYDTLKDIIQVEAPLENFFNKFDTYIYTPVNRKFDCSPRLVTECFMQGKKVFKELDYCDIGLETRYNDCINNLERLNLTENDDILKILNIKV